MAYDFPASPTPGQTFNNYVWDGEKWKLQSPPVTGAVRYDIAQGLTSTQKAQARANIDVAKKNYIINGAMMISQENGATAGSVSGYYPVDQFRMFYANAGTQTAQNLATTRTPGGSYNRLRVTATVADAAVAAGDYCAVYQPIEGYRVADLGLGYTVAKTVTLQFGVKAPAGTYCVCFYNIAGNRTYIAEYVIAAGEANTDVVKSITLALDTRHLGGNHCYRVDSSVDADVRSHIHHWRCQCVDRHRQPVWYGQSIQLHGHRWQRLRAVRRLAHRRQRRAAVSGAGLCERAGVVPEVFLQA